MKITTKKTALLFALCLLTTTSVFSTNKKMSNKEVVTLLEKALKKDSTDYIEDVIDKMHNAGHPNLANFLNELRQGYKTTNLPLEAYGLFLVAKYKISLALANKVRIVMNKIKGQDHIWQAALERTRPNVTVMTGHAEEDYEYDDSEGHHKVHVKADIEVEDTVAPAA